MQRMIKLHVLGKAVFDKLNWIVWKFLWITMQGRSGPSLIMGLQLFRKRINEI